jgi:hypothetical protein
VIIHQGIVGGLTAQAEVKIPTKFWLKIPEERGH